MLSWGKKEDEPEKSAADRDSDRHDLAVRARSRQLPGYRAITVDISRSGVQLETQELLDMGEVLMLDLEFDHDELPDLSVPAKVVWSKRDGDRRSRFLAGLTFQPRDHQGRLELARMATVLQARSEADLEDLLEEAKKLDPERSATFMRQAPRRTTIAMKVHPGVFIPLKITLEGYQWDRAGGELYLRFSEGEHRFQLVFPDCQRVTDYGCATEALVVGLYSTFSSDLIREIQGTRGATEWKQYRFVAQGHEPILDIISLECESRG